MKIKFKLLCAGLALLAIVIFATASIAKSKKVRDLHPKDMFNHEMHTDSFFTPNNVPCESCHINDNYEWKKMNRGGCHDCHKSAKYKDVDYASKDCATCHTSWTVTPANHRVNWKVRHKTNAKVDPKTCKSCHNDRFCIKCHEQRNDVILQVHDRNYKYFHSIDARVNPKKCDRCHQVAFCTRCHVSRRLR
jgi:hypothetical protein